MALDPIVEADLLDWIGGVQDGEDIEATFLIRGTVHAAALSILRRRRANLGPDSFSLSGDYAESDGGRRAAWLDSQIRRLADLCGEPVDAMKVTAVTRVQPGR